MTSDSKSLETRVKDLEERGHVTVALVTQLQETQTLLLQENEYLRKALTDVCQQHAKQREEIDRLSAILAGRATPRQGPMVNAALTNGHSYTGAIVSTAGGGQGVDEVSHEFQDLRSRVIDSMNRLDRWERCRGEERSIGRLAN
mmetsp:Transcript_44014/g.70343  ORF Transcript_44014/g.70343 Transcript_44014/m.70343 type:complete len:144 (+) Transcript_44014:39-470(+)